MKLERENNGHGQEDRNTKDRKQRQISNTSNEPRVDIA